MNNLFNEKLLNKKANEEVDLDKHNLKKRREYLNKWINNLENGVLDKSKEEEFQGEFLYDIFTIVLRAVNKSDGKNEWNLERETKTKLDGQKADGVLGFFDIEGKKDVRAVIELKGAKVSLDVRQKRAGDTRTPVEQAFGYAPKYGSSCQWVIVSNYKEIRLYRQTEMNEYQVFFLENLKDDLEFKKFIYVLSFYSLVGTENKKAKTMELSEEYQKNQTEIEKKFYNEYKTIRLHIFENMRKNNPTVNENIIIEKVQKLLDRFLFICFCEDKGLLPNEIFYKTLEKGKNFGDIFEVFKMLCNWINLGNPRENISHFNGGLFKNDDVLDGLYVDNEVFEEMRKISEYDFDSELNENILGHIFEQSVSDIEELKKSVSGEEFDSKKSKRKKDGIFYTPKYITKYIVENSIKNWLDDKRKELGEDELPELTEKDFEIKYASKKSDKRIYSENFKKHIDFWTKYREAVKNIKIVDPACGSGAFLITAFEYLLNYNDYLDNKIFDLTGVKDLFSDTTKEILQNNIFGVDLNKESVEITKLSLWLKTADKNKTLASLENNIKCGNSLIDDIEIAGELAFDWEKEFPQVFENGGFDIVVGNPPYGAKIDKEIQKYLNEKYIKGGSETVISFLKLVHSKLMKSNASFGFIIPKSFSFSSNYKYIRNELKDKILEIVDCKKVWKEVRLEQVIIFTKNIGSIEKYLSAILKGKEIIPVGNIEKSTYEEFQFFLNGISEKELKIAKKMKNFKFYIGNICKNSRGLALQKFLKSEGTVKVIGGAEIQREGIRRIKGFIEEKDISNKEKMLIGKNSLLVQNLVAHIENPIDHIKIVACISEDKNYALVDTINQLSFDKKYSPKVFYCLLNSKLINWYSYRFIFAKAIRTMHFDSGVTDRIPIPRDLEQPLFIEKADKMLFLNKNLQELSQKFQRLLTRKFELEKLSTKLQEWYLLEFSEFVKELKKSKIKLSLKEEMEWEEIFLENKEEAEKVKNEIEMTDKEIDRMVYEVYGLSEEEIRIVES